MAPKSTDMAKGQFGRIDILNETYGPVPRACDKPATEKLKEILTIGEECIKEEELLKLLENKPHPVCYDGFEPSGRMHIAQGVLKSLNVNKLTRNGCVFVFWVADWFAMLNNKMGGDLNKIKVVGEYFIEVWKACGMDMTNVRFLWTSEEIAKDPNGYWLRVMDVAKASSISRVKRCGQIMGRAEGDEQPCSQIMYPCMQCADIFYIGADICQLGIDQRKVNMLARDYCETKKYKNKPVILSHGMVPGLLEGQEKMSKSDPDSAIFMEDPPHEIRRKIKKAYCPPGIYVGNPCAYYVEHIVFVKNGIFKISRSAENGGDKEYTDIEEFKADILSGALHPGDLKAALSMALVEIIKPVAEHFENDDKAKAILKKIKSWKVTK